MTTYILTAEDSQAFLNPYYQQDVEQEVLAHIWQTLTPGLIDVQLDDGRCAFLVWEGEILDV